MAKKIAVNLDELEALAAKGYSITMCCEAIGITRTTAYNNSYIIDTIKRGAAKAKQEVIDHLMVRSLSDQSATATIFLAKQLKVFSTPYPTSTPTTPTEATKRISKLYKDVSSGLIDEDKASALVSYLQAYIKSYEVTELEERITKIEKFLDEK